MTRFFCNSVGDIREALLTPIAQKQLTGIRGLMNHVASWSGRVIDRQAFLIDPNERLCFEDEAKRLEGLLNDARREVSAKHLKRLRTRTFHSRCELVLSLADELKADLVELLALQMFTSVERFAGQAAKHDWPMVSRELEGELDWLKSNQGKPTSNAEKPTKKRTHAWLGSVETLATEFKLKGKQRRVVELLIEGGGSLRIADIASDTRVGWKIPYKSAVDGIKAALNEKFGQRGYLFDQFDGSLFVKPMATKPQKQK